MAHTTTTNSTWYARIVLALVFSVFAASAQAATIYNFTFANQSDSSSVIANGFFTTDGAAVDFGYELIESITFDRIVGMTGTVYVGPFTATTFEAGAAYNPATGGFLNHAGGGSYSGLGLTTTYRHPWGQTVEIYGYAFRPNGSIFDATIRFGDDERIHRLVNLDVTPAAVPEVPEPASLMLLGSGLLGVVASRRRARR